MSGTPINPMILKKLEERNLPPHVKSFLVELLKFEKGKLDQEGSHYSSAYTTSINKYVTQPPEAKS